MSTWADVLNWRNAIYNVVINAFKNVGDMAPHLHQLGYRDKAWCVAWRALYLTWMQVRATNLHPCEYRARMYQCFK